MGPNSPVASAHADEGNAAMHPATLVFCDQATEAAFQVAYAAATARVARIASLFMLLLAAFLCAVTQWQLPQYVADRRGIDLLLMYTALVDVPALLAVYLLSPTPWFRRNAQPLLVAIAAVAAIGAKLALVALPLDFTVPYGHILEITVVISALTAIHLRFVSGLAFAAIETVTYVAVASLLTPFPAMHRIGHANALLLVFAVGLFACYLIERYERVTFWQRQLLDRERAKSERLLLNVLPAPIAARLKESGESIADAFTDVTVLFADIAGFTSLSARLPPAALVAKLNAIFSRFDELSERYGLEKIKTIGDAYMVAGGLPQPRPDHAECVAEFALAMTAVVREFDDDPGARLRIRIGIHSGPVVAGVIGTKKFHYDLWGDTVNVAARMESHGETDEIHVSEAVHQRLHDRFDTVARGEIDVKGKGAMRTWWLKGRKGAAS